MMKEAYLKIKPVKESIVVVADFISDEMENNNVSIKDANKISIAVDEMYSNVVNYSNATDSEIYCGVDADKIIIKIIDNGNPFDPTQIENPNTHQSAEERKVGGLGIFMTKKLMTSLHYTYKDHYNHLMMELKVKDVDK